MLVRFRIFHMFFIIGCEHMVTREVGFCAKIEVVGTGHFQNRINGFD